MNKESLELVIEYNKLPLTAERAAIDSQYMNDEISVHEFLVLARAYIEEAKIKQAGEIE